MTHPAAAPSGAAPAPRQALRLVIVTDAWEPQVNGVVTTMRNTSRCLEEPLTRHPELRVYVMHAGWPMLDDTMALMWTHPQVYVGMGCVDAARDLTGHVRAVRLGRGHTGCADVGSR